MMRKISGILVIFFFASCGAGSDHSHSGGGSVGLKIVDERGFDANIEHYLPMEYVVTITGEGIEEEIIAKFDGNASEGSVHDVPVGEGRVVKVEAINFNGVKIKSGAAHGIVVGENQSDVEVEMKYHPVFANLTDGATIENTRLTMKLLADPSNAVRVMARRMDDDSANSFSISDEPTASDLFYADEGSWAFAVSPSILDSGRYRFSAIDDLSGLGSSVEIRVVEGRGVIPAPLVGLTASTPDVSASIIPINGNFRMEVFR